MKKVLVTGANGMLASNLIDELLRKDYNVIELSEAKVFYDKDI